MNIVVQIESEKKALEQTINDFIDTVPASVTVMILRDYVSQLEDISRQQFNSAMNEINKNKEKENENGKSEQENR